MHLEILFHLLHVGIAPQSIVSAIIDVYPNPATATSIIKWDKTFPFSTLEIYNVIGKSVLKTNVSNLSSFIVECNLYKEGVYYIKLSGNNGNNYTKKLIIL